LPGPPLPLGGSIFLPLATQTITWNHKNASFDPNNLYQDEESLALAGHPSGGITYADEATLGANTVADYTDNQTTDLSKALQHGTKVLHFHGTADPAIFWRTSADYYRRVATWLGHGKPDFGGLQRWYRFFPIPDVGHGTGSSGGGPGPSPVDPFVALVKWAEKSEAPASIMALASPPALKPGRTRPLWPGVVRGTEGSRLFVQMLGVGFDARVVHQLSVPLKRAHRRASCRFSRTPFRRNRARRYYPLYSWARSSACWRDRSWAAPRRRHLAGEVRCSSRPFPACWPPC